jgi:hypothetical protein
MLLRIAIEQSPSEANSSLSASYVFPKFFAVLRVAHD